MALSNKSGRTEADFVKEPTPEHFNLTTVVSIVGSKCSDHMRLFKHPKEQVVGLLVEYQYRTSAHLHIRSCVEFGTCIKMAYGRPAMPLTIRTVSNILDSSSHVIRCQYQLNCIAKIATLFPPTIGQCPTYLIVQVKLLGAGTNWIALPRSRRCFYR